MEKIWERENSIRAVMSIVNMNFTFIPKISLVLLYHNTYTAQFPPVYSGITNRHEMDGNTDPHNRDAGIVLPRRRGPGNNKPRELGDDIVRAGNEDGAVSDQPVAAGVLVIERIA